MSNFSFNGYMENVLTFECDSNVKAGDPVAMTGSGRVGKAAENSAFIGICINEKNGIAAVQLNGYVETDKSGTVNVGFNKLVVAADGVKTGTTGREYLVIFSDEDTIGFIM